MSVFLVFVCGFVGSMCTLYTARSHLFKCPWLLSWLTMFSAGMMTSLAMTHITSDVIIELNQHIQFPLGACCVMCGMLFMTITTDVAQCWKGNANVDIEQPLNKCSLCGQNESRLTATTKNSIYKKTIYLYLFEAVCVFHNFMIGFGLGVTTQENSKGGLCLALCLHQFLEGISLGSITSETEISIMKGFGIAFGYSVTAPIGIIIGVVLDASPWREQDIKNTIISCIQGFAGGLLLYVAMFQMAQDELDKKKSCINKWQKLNLYTALIIGASLMSLMALWL